MAYGTADRKATESFSCKRDIFLNKFIGIWNQAFNLQNFPYILTVDAHTNRTKKQNRTSWRHHGRSWHLIRQPAILQHAAFTVHCGAEERVAICYPPSKSRTQTDKGSCDSSMMTETRQLQVSDGNTLSGSASMQNGCAVEPWRHKSSGTHLLLCFNHCFVESLFRRCLLHPLAGAVRQRGEAECPKSARKKLVVVSPVFSSKPTISVPALKQVITNI